MDDPAGAEVVAYERGLSVQSIARGTTLRFLPAAVLTVVVGLYLIAPASVSLAEVVALVLAGMVAPLAMGFGLGLEAMRRWLYPDARVEGRRSVIAGLLAPLVLFFISGVTLNAAEVALVSVVIGVVMAVTTFFAWLTPTPEEMRGVRPRNEARRIHG